MTTKTALWPLQQAIFQRLSSDPSIAGIAKGVFDSVGKDQAYPYITVGEPVTLPLETKNTYSEEISIVVHTWSVYEGKRESYALLDAVAQAIHRGIRIDAPFTLQRVTKPRLQVIDDLDPRIKHGMARYTFTIKNN